MQCNAMVWYGYVMVMLCYGNVMVMFWLWYGCGMVMVWVCYGHVMLCYVILCYVMLWYGMVWYGMLLLCCVVLCYVMVWYVMLCYVMVCCCVVLRLEYGMIPGSSKIRGPPPQESLFFLKADGYNRVWYNFEVGYGMVSMNGYLCMYGYVWCGMIYHVMFCYVSMDGWIHLSSKILLLSLPFPSRFEGDYRSWWWATCHLTARGAAWSDVR